MNLPKMLLEHSFYLQIASLVFTHWRKHFADHLLLVKCTSYFRKSLVCLHKYWIPMHKCNR